jgi:hypothetical protein
MRTFPGFIIVYGKGNDLLARPGRARRSPSPAALSACRPDFWTLTIAYHESPD